MTLTDYPGHLVAVVLVLAPAVLVFVIFRTDSLQTPERTKYRRLLAAMQYAVILSLLVILWNPSAWRTQPVFDRNTVLTLFDTSESMSVADDGRLPRLDKALDKLNGCFRSSGAGGPEYRTYGFDDHPYHCGSPDLLRRWGSASNLQEVFSLIADSAARDAQGATAGAPTGVVVFTDGQAGDKNPRRYLPMQREDLPILLVGVGSRRPHADIAVKSILAPASTPTGTPFAVAAAIVVTGALNEPVALELLCDGTLIDSHQLTREQFRSSGAGPQEATTEFALPAQGLGTRVLTARVKAVKGEVNLANNSRSTVVEVAPPRALEVLLYSQWANFDIGKIRQALAWDKQIHLSLGFDVVRESWPRREHAYASVGMAPLPETKEEFYKYDVIILGPCDLGTLTPIQREGLYDFVAERGGGLLLLPGQTITSLAAWRDEKADAILPVVFDKQTPRLWPPRADAITLTFEAQVGRIFDPNAFTNPVPSISPYYEVAETKPASTTLATVGNVPIIAAHRLGRGRVCLLNASKLFTLYREDRQGGLLSELVCGLVAYVGRTPAQGAGVELFVERTADDPRRVTFNAYVVDKVFQPVAGANVLLTVGDQTVSMEPTGRGYYRTTLDRGLAQSIVATAQAELNGSFLGERTIATSLPPVRDEMSCIDLDEPFLRALAQRTGGRYLHIDEINQETANLFVPKHQIGVTETVSSLWPKWPVLIALCLLLSAGWFIRRAIGLV